MVDFSGYFETYLDILPLILIVVSLYWTRIVGGPWVPTSMKMVNRMMEMAEVGPEDIVYDLGCEMVGWFSPLQCAIMRVQSGLRSIRCVTSGVSS